MAYYGGKQHLAGWINSRLPRREAYCEPFAGMLSVLLARPPSKVEIANDLDGNLVNWWTVVREDPEGLRELLDWTPHSRSVWRDARERVRAGGGSRLRRAWAYHIAMGQSFGGTPRTSRMGWVCGYKGGTHNGWRFPRERFAELAARLRDVQLECRPAEEVLEGTLGCESMVVYCDPPYHTTDRRYANNTVEVEVVAALLREHKGEVAISGYDAEWDCLGWERSECDTTSAVVRGRGESTRRNVLWTNYAPPQGDMFR